MIEFDFNDEERRVFNAGFDRGYYRAVRDMIEYMEAEKQNTHRKR